MKLQDLSECYFNKVMEINNLDLESCICLKNDCCVNINSNTTIFYKCPTTNQEKISFDTVYNDFPDNSLFSLNDTFKLHSRPESSNKIYLDFLGGDLLNTRWNIDYRKVYISYNRFHLGMSNYLFDDYDMIRIQQIWKGVSEDFAPFDVDITTEKIDFYNARCIITNSTSNELFKDGSYGGVAYLNSWNYPIYKTCWCFNPNSLNLLAAIQTVSHEIGHTLGLKHQGTRTSEYYKGYGGWGPIMGASFTQKLSQWSYVPNGETYMGTSTQPSINQNDLAIINKTLSYIDDDYPSSIEETINSIMITTNTLNTFYGTISENTDNDFFKFGSGIGNIVINCIISTTDSNLDLGLTLFDSSYNQITIGAKNELNSTINYFGEKTSVYYLKVNGIGNNYYTNYGSLGKYKLNFNLQAYVTLPKTEIITTKKNIFNEEPAIFKININLPDNTIIYWKNIGTSKPTDFKENINQGEIIVNNNTCILQLTPSNIFDKTNNMIIIRLYMDSIFSTIIATSEVTYINNLTITTNINNIFEGDSVIFTINVTPNDNTNTILYWKNEGNSDQTNFNENINNRSVVINNNIGIIKLSVNYNSVKLNNQTIKIKLYNNNLYKDSISESENIFINKVLYTIVPRKLTINESELITFDITTNDNNNIIYWNNIGTTNAYDFKNVQNSGTVSISQNNGVLNLLTINDKHFEGSESVIIKLSKSLSFDSYYVLSPSVQINDTSIPIINLISLPYTNVTEGNSVVFTIVADIANNTNLYWTNNGTTNASDFIENISNGIIQIIDNVAKIILTPKTNLQLNNKTISIYIRNNSINGEILASRQISINAKN
jgi:hypothetical protein